MQTSHVVNSATEKPSHTVGVPGAVARSCFHQAQTQEPGCAPWNLPTAATALLGQHRAAWKDLAPDTELTKHPNDLPWQKQDMQLQLQAVNPGKRKDVPPRTETRSHPIKLAVSDMPNLTASWEAAQSDLCWEELGVHTLGTAHTEMPCLTENGDCAMAALLHFITRLKDPALEKTSSGKKKTFWPALAFLTINLFKATD